MYNIYISVQPCSVLNITVFYLFQDSISAVIAKYSSNGYMDILTEKWYGGLPCFKLSPDYGIQPKPLGKLYVKEIVSVVPENFSAMQTETIIIVYTKVPN